jgi:hypothetical protein
VYLLHYRKAIENGCDTSVCLLNYRVDGATFWNQFFIAALRDGDGKIINYVGVQCKVSEEFVMAVQKQEDGDDAVSSSYNSPITLLLTCLVCYYDDAYTKIGTRASLAVGTCMHTLA